MSGLFAGTPLERPVTCEQCGKPHAQCTCPRNGMGKVVVPKDQRVRVQRESRRGKTVTVIRGLEMRESDLAAMLKHLKGKFAAGGAVAEGAIELQGDHRDRLVEYFKGLGYPAKAAGG